MRRDIHPPPERLRGAPKVSGRGLRDIHDLEGYVSDALAGIGVGPTSDLHPRLLAHGVRFVYRVERAVPPEASLRAVMDQVLPERLRAGLRRTPALAGPAVATAA